MVSVKQHNAVYRFFSSRKDVGSVSRGAKIIIYALLIILAVIFIVPFLLTIGISFSTQNSIVQNGYQIIPAEFTLDGYKYIFNDLELILISYKNSVLSAVIGTILNVLLCILVAYPLSNFNFKWRRSIGFYVYFTMMFGGGLIPYYILIKQYLHMDNSLWVLIIPALVSPGNVFLLRVFMQQVPKEIYESAKIDGAGEYRILFNITVPLVKSGIATVALFIVLAYWNDVMTPRMFIDQRELMTLPKLLDSYSLYVNQAMSSMLMTPGIRPPEDAMIFGMCVISTGPMLFVFLFFQKYFVKGMVLGAVKG